MSNIVAIECTRVRVWIKAANNAEWSLTRDQIIAIYQSKSGSRASRISSTITDVRASMIEALGSYIDGPLTDLEFDPDDSSRNLLLMIRSI